MLKRGFVALIFLTFLFAMPFAIAQDADTSASTDTSADSSAEIDSSDSSSTDTAVDTASSDAQADSSTSSTDNLDASAQLSVDAGITPDSGLYFVEDKILSKFRGDIENREKKIAEVHQMIKEGKTEEARRSLSRYKQYAGNVEKEVNPEDKAEAQRSSSAIRNTLKDIESDVSTEDKKEFIDDINDQESKIATAAEIAAKIKDLCQTLAKVDPEQYALTCRTKDNAPKWQKDLDIKLTKEQESEAEEFFNVMSSCMRDPKSCNCDKISVKPFAEECSIVAPLAAKCMAGDSSACEEMELREDPSELLPPHLQHVFERLEGQYSDAEFDNHMPLECKDAGAKTKDECFKVMFKLNAPEECVQALESGKISIKNEREARTACEAIMFSENAPEECIEAGLKDHKSCGKFMFQQNAPEECIEAGLTGERGTDAKKCQKLMKDKFSQEGGFESQEGMDGEGPRGQGFGFGHDCSGIQDKDEKLKCFESIFSDTQQRSSQSTRPKAFGTDFDKSSFPPECQEAGATTPESCGQYMREQGRKKHQDQFGSNPGDEFNFEDHPPREGQPRDQRNPRDFQQDPSNNQQRSPPCNSPEECAKMFGNNPPQDFNRQPMNPDQFNHPNPNDFQKDPNQQPMNPDQFNQPGNFNQPPTGTNPADTQQSPPQDQQQHSEPAPAPAPAAAPSEPAPSSAPVTGNVVFNTEGNGFLSYYFR